MGLLTDILKDIPLAANLQEKIRTLESKYAALETENAILKDDLRDSNLANANLTKEIGKLTDSFDPDETAKKILSLVAQDATYKQELELSLKLHPTRIEYYLHQLIERRYIVSKRSMRTRPTSYHLTQKGREYVLRNDLL